MYKVITKKEMQRFLNRAELEGDTEYEASLRHWRTYLQIESTE